MISRDSIQKIQDNLKIEEVISDFVTLKRRGADYVACCPFHNEKTPSFHVSPSKGIFKCFGCGKSGSAVSFVMEHEHCSYTEAMKYIAKKYHVEVVEEEVSAEELMSRQKRDSLFLVNEFALKFYVEQLSTQEGRSVAMAYYHRRGLEDETIVKEALGWAPSAKRAFTDAALAAGYKEEYLLELGLTVKTENGGLVDRFRERVMFPIYSVSGRVIAFSGRTLKADNPAKYVNSPESELYVKSRSLLGIYQAKGAISRNDKCYLVEGNLDVITLHQLGIMNVVASCGTSLTVEQIRLIRKFSSNLTIMYDGDGAGIKAALRGTDMVLEEGMKVRIVLLPLGEDPDSFGRTHSLAEFESYIAENEQDFVSFKSEILLKEAASDPLRRAEVINDIADTIAKIPDPVTRSVFAREVAEKFGIEEKIIFGRIGRQNRAAVRKQDAAAAAKPEVVKQEEKRKLENEFMAPVEFEILSFLLRYGDKELRFPYGSPLVDESGISVADFIVNALEDDSYSMANSLYECIYLSFKTMYYDQGLDRDVLVRNLLDGEDRAVAEVVADIVIDRYEITSDKMKSSLTSEESWLAIHVPKCLYNLALKRLENHINCLKREIASLSDPQQQLAILEEIRETQNNILKIKEKNVL